MKNELFNKFCELKYADKKYPGLFYKFDVDNIHGKYLIFVVSNKDLKQLLHDYTFVYNVYSVEVKAGYNIHDFDNAIIRYFGSVLIENSPSIIAGLEKEFLYWKNQI